MTLNNFEKIVEGKIVARGFEYYEEDLVEDVSQVDVGEYSAVVSGSERYNVFIKLKGVEVKEWECDCPYDWGNICKHTVAVLYYIRDAELNKKKPDTTLLSVLRDVSDKQLRTFVHERLKRDRKLRRAFLREFTDEDFDDDYDEDDY